MEVGAHIEQNWLQRNLKGDPIIWSIVFAFSLISILVVYSATGTLAFSKYQGNTEYFLMKHTILMLLGVLSMWVAHRLDYRHYRNISRFALWFSVPLLIYTAFYGVELNDANRWLEIPIINQTFMPSDFAKLALISGLAGMLSKRQGNITDVKEIGKMLLWCGIICGLIALSDLSTAMMLFSTCMLLMFIGRVPIRYIFLLVIVGVLAGSIALAFGQRAGTASSRIDDYICATFGDCDPSYQAEQSYIAIAKGGTVRFAPGQSVQRNFLPHPYSDFIYAIIIEEYGLIGGVIVLFLYLALLYRGMAAVSKSNKAFGGLLSAGLSFSLVLQAMINMGVTVGLGPVTGLPLPLLSMGGTSLLFTGLSIGIIISVSRGEKEESNTNGNKVKNG